MSMVTMSQSYWAADKMLGLAMPHAYEAFPRIGWIRFLRFFGQLFLRTLWRGTENQTTRAVSTSQQQLVDLQILWSGPSMWNGLQLPGQRCFHCSFFGSCLECWAMGVTVVQYRYIYIYRYSIIEATLALHQFLSFHGILTSWQSIWLHVSALRLLLHSPVDFKLVKPILCLQVQPAQFPRSYPSWRWDPLHLWDIGFTIWTGHSSVPMDDAVLVQFCKNRCGFWFRFEWLRDLKSS